MTKELKKEHSFRPVAGVEIGSWVVEDAQQGGSWRTRQARWRLVDQLVSHLYAENQEEQLGSEIA